MKYLPAFLKSSSFLISNPHIISASYLFGFIVWKYLIRCFIFFALAADTGSNINLVFPLNVLIKYSTISGLSESSIIYSEFFIISDFESIKSVVNLSIIFISTTADTISRSEERRVGKECRSRRREKQVRKNKCKEK